MKQHSRSWTRRALGVLCAVALCFGLTPAFAFADSGDFANPADGNSYQWWNFSSGQPVIVSSITVDNGNVVIPAEINGLAVVNVGNKLTQYSTYNQPMTTLTLPASMGDSSAWGDQFKNIDTLTTVTLNNGHMLSKGEFAFCDLLHDVYLNGDQSGLDFKSYAVNNSPFEDVKQLRFHIAEDNTNLETFVSGMNAVSGYTYTILQTTDMTGVTIDPVPNQELTGTSCEPALTVKNAAGDTLVAGTDYSVAYTNNTATGTATATITGLDKDVSSFPQGKVVQYSGTKSVNFTINAPEDKFNTYAAWGMTILSSMQIYSTDNVVIPDSLAEGTSGLALGNQMINYCTFAQPIKSLTLPSNMVSSGWSKQFKGSPSLEKVTLNNGYKLEKQLFGNCPSLHDVYLLGDQSGLDFNSMTVSNSPFEGTTQICFHIAEPNAKLTSFVEGCNATAGYDYTIMYNTDLAGATIDPVTDQVFTGSAIEPSVTVKNAAGDMLAAGTDYTLSYADNVAVGVATITITGTSVDLSSQAMAVQAEYEGYEYSGTNTVTFNITPASMDDVVVGAIPDQIYTGSETRPPANVTLGGNPLIEGTDYVVSYSEDPEAGIGIMTITGLGNVVGTITTQYRIVPAPQETTPTTVKTQVSKTSGKTVLAKTSDSVLPGAVALMLLAGAGLSLYARRRRDQ